jgi:hypothetical protein
MSIFKKNKETENKKAFKIDSVESITFSVKNLEPEPIKEPEEEWIWVEGYKGTDKNMQGYGNFQFEIGKQYDMPEDAKIEVCQSGFHFSKKLIEVFNHYDLCISNRFFKIKALVRKKDYERGYSYNPHNLWSYDKLVAKSIILEKELTTEEILKAACINIEDFSKEEQEQIREIGLEKVLKNKKIHLLVEECGFSFPFASLIVNENKEDRALAIGLQNGLSMDMKAYLIFNT